MLQSLFTAGQYARYRSFLGTQPESVADELSDASFWLADAEARQVAYEAYRDFRAWNIAMERLFDAQAVAAEFDLTLTNEPGPEMSAPTPTAEEAQEAYALACRLAATENIVSEDACAIVYGACLLDPESAYVITRAAFESKPFDTGV